MWGCWCRWEGMGWGWENKGCAVANVKKSVSHDRNIVFKLFTFSFTTTDLLLQERFTSWCIPEHLQHFTNKKVRKLHYNLIIIVKKLWVDQHNSWQDNRDAFRSIFPRRNSWGVPEPQHFTNKTVRKLRYATSLPLSIIITVTKLWVNQRNRWQQRCNQVSVSTDKIATT